MTDHSHTDTLGGSLGQFPPFAHVVAASSGCADVGLAAIGNRAC